MTRHEPEPETWAGIPLHHYAEISNLGRLRHSQTKRTVATWPDINGHLCSSLRFQGNQTSVRISRLVGAAFCPSYRQHLRPFYVDGNKTNCRATNLKWVPMSRLCNPPIGARQGRSRLTEKQALAILRNHPNEKISAISARHKVSTTTIYNLIHRITWKHLTP